jgi:hypothetical protein
VALPSYALGKLGEGGMWLKVSHGSIRTCMLVSHLQGFGNGRQRFLRRMGRWVPCFYWWLTVPQSYSSSYEEFNFSLRTSSLINLNFELSSFTLAEHFSSDQ